MNKNITPYIIVIAVLALMNIATLATLWLRPMGPPPPGRPHAESFIERELNLTAEQATQFKELREQHFAQTHSLEPQVRESRRRIIEQLAKNPPDTAAAQAIGKTNLNTINTLDSLLIQHFLEIRNILTPEQQEKLGHLFLESMRHHEPPRRKFRPE